MARAVAPALDALLADACVVVSCLIQHGVEPREIASSMGRLGNAEPASIIGAVDRSGRGCKPSQQQIPRGGRAHDRRTDASQRRRSWPSEAQSYGDAAASMAAIAARWSLTLGHTVTPAQVVLCMIDLKLARLVHDPKHRDSIADVMRITPPLLPEVTR